MNRIRCDVKRGIYGETRHDRLSFSSWILLINKNINMQNGYAGDNENDSQVDMLNIVTYPFVKKQTKL